MSYYVDMQQTDFYPFGHEFSVQEAAAIRAARPHCRFEIAGGWGTLKSDGSIVIALGTLWRFRTYALNYAILCDQLSAAEADAALAGAEDESDDAIFN